MSRRGAQRVAAAVPRMHGDLYRMSLDELSAEANRVLAAASASETSPEAAARASGRSTLHPLFAIAPAIAIAATFVHIATGYELQDDRRPAHDRAGLTRGSTLGTHDSAPLASRSRAAPAPAAVLHVVPPASAPSPPVRESTSGKITPAAPGSSAPSELTEYQASLGAASTRQPACLPSRSSQLAANRAVLPSSDS